MENGPNGGDDENELNGPFGVSEDPKAVQKAIEAEEAKTEAERRAKYAEAGRIAGEATINRNGLNNNQGFTIDEDDPIEGGTDNPEIIRVAEKKLEKLEQKDESANDIEPKAEKTRVAPELSPNQKRLKEVFEKSEKVRELYKDPGDPRYRILSVAAVELGRVEQPDDPAERVKKNNEMIEKAAKKAVGENQLDKFSGDTVAAAQEFISEDLIGDNADSVSIGTTETIVNQFGEIGKNREINYRNLVVVRWIKKGINHVVAFSPSKDAAIYALVDDSMGDSWRNKFFMAGAVDGEEREEISIMNHINKTDTYLHERTFEKVVCAISRKEMAALESDELGVKDRAAIGYNIAKQVSSLAHSNEKMLAGMVPYEEEKADKALDEEEEDSDDDGISDNKK
ncbi:hypothetical protein IKF20_00365 [Candidatus Saccharibacteria bacterium]|nr:hypothetical protein [Candidatus Saccharibacteria bacterium]